MANAKKCDICGDYYDVPQPKFLNDEMTNTSFITFARVDPNNPSLHDRSQFDTCEKCWREIMDYILARQAKPHA